MGSFYDTDYSIVSPKSNSIQEEKSPELSPNISEDFEEDSSENDVTYRQTTEQPDHLDVSAFEKNIPILVTANPKITEWLKDKQKQEKKKISEQKLCEESKKRLANEENEKLEQRKKNEQEKVSKWLKSKKSEEMTKITRQKEVERKKNIFKQEQSVKNKLAFETWLKKHPFQKPNYQSIAFYNHRKISVRSGMPATGIWVNHEPWTNS